MTERAASPSLPHSARSTGAIGWERLALDLLEGQAVIVLDAEGRIRTWNDAAWRLTGYAAPDVIGQTWDVLAAAPDSPVAQTLRRVAETGRWETSRWWRRAGGGLFWAREVVFPGPHDELDYLLFVYDETGARTASHEQAAGVLREQHASEQVGMLHGELERAEWRASFLAEASSILVASSLDLEGTIKALARLAASRLADWCVVHATDAEGAMRRIEIAHRDPRQERAIGSGTTGALRPARGNPLLAVLRTGAGVVLDSPGANFFAGVADNDEQAELLKQYGARSALIVPLLGRGKVLGTVTLASVASRYEDEDLAIAEELARRAAIAIDNARLFREAQEANRAKADFLAVMSHELRTPLNAIMGYADLLDAEITGPVVPKQRRQLGRIRASARHLLQLIEEILAFARMTDGGEEVVMEEVAAEAVAREAIALTEPLASAKGLELVLDARSSIRLRSDGAKIRQILLNLLSNAVKFTDRGTVTLLVTASDDHLVFELCDTGIGITADQLELIFEPFWQAEKPTTRRTGGTGLGLSVSRRFARLLGGDIVAHSKAGQGACFRVELPRHPAPDPPGQRTNASPEA